MRCRYVALFCAALFLLVGCVSQVQQPTSPTTNSILQEQLQSATHWQTIAKEQQGEYIYQALTNPKFKLVDSDGNAPAIYISESDKSPFGVAMRKYLISWLMSDDFKKNHPVEINLSSKPDAPIVVSWETQLVNRAPWRPKPFHGVPAFILEAVAFIFAGGGWHTSDVGVPHTELILTTMIDLRDLKMARHSDTYFINDDDGGNYWQNPEAYAYSKSIRAKDDAMRSKFAQTGQLAQ